MGFSIDTANLSWVNDKKDDPEDLCLHGYASVYIGGQKVEFDNATVSAAALYLLKTLTEDHIIHTDNQLLPCCGHFIIPNDALDNVTISGCDNGADWTVLHDGNELILELEDGTRDRVPFEEYKREVFRFADKIEAYYKACSPKKLPEDKLERDGYTAFWAEWHRRRNI